MATPGFFNENANRAYPFVPPSVSQPGTGAVRNLPKAAVVDAGFVLGTGAAFDAAFAEVFKAPPQALFATWCAKQARASMGRR